MEANDWVRANPKLAAEKIEEWTKIEKEVAYIFLGPGGIHTLDPTIKPRWLDTIKIGHGVLQKLNRVKELDISAWVNETYVRQAFKELKLDYDTQKQPRRYDITGKDPLCKTAITRPKEAGEIWVDGGDDRAVQLGRLHAGGDRQARRREARRSASPTSSTRRWASRCSPTRPSTRSARSDPKKPEIVPFLLKKDAEGARREDRRQAGHLRRSPEGRVQQRSERHAEPTPCPVPDCARVEDAEALVTRAAGEPPRPRLDLSERWSSCRHRRRGRAVRRRAAPSALRVG